MRLTGAVNIGRVAQDGIAAGGPGSGPRPGFGNPVNKQLHDELVQRGFSYTGNHKSYVPATAIARKGVLSQYSHADGTTARTHSGGNWGVTEWHGGVMGRGATGIGVDSLRKHLGVAS